MSSDRPYPKPWRPDAVVVELEIADKLKTIAELAEVAQVDLGDSFAEARDKVARARNFADRIDARRENRDSAARRIARAVVAGELDVDGAVREAINVEAMAYGSVINTVEKLTASIAARGALDDARATIDPGLLDTARAAAAEVLDDVRALRKTLAGVTSAEQATTGGPKTAAAWSRYRTELLPRWNAIHDLVGELRSLGWIEPVAIGPLVSANGSVSKYGRPDLIATKNLELLDERADRAEPGGPFTAAELEHYERQIFEAEDAQAARRGLRPAVNI